MHQCMVGVSLSLRGEQGVRLNESFQWIKGGPCPGSPGVRMSVVTDTEDDGSARDSQHPAF